MIFQEDSFAEDLPSLSARPLSPQYCLLSHIVKRHIKIKCFLNDVCLLNSVWLQRECTWLASLSPSFANIKDSGRWAACSVACAPPSVHITPTVGQLRWLQPKLEFSGVCRPLSQRPPLPSLLLVSLTAVTCTVRPDLFTEWRHRSPHSHLAGAEGCDRTFTRLNGPAWPPQSTPGMQQPPTRLI